MKHPPGSVTEFDESETAQAEENPIGSEVPPLSRRTFVKVAGAAYGDAELVTKAPNILEYQTALYSMGLRSNERPCRQNLPALLHYVELIRVEIIQLIHLTAQPSDLKHVNLFCLS